MLHIKEFRSVSNLFSHLHLFFSCLIAHHVNNAGHEICWLILYTAEATQAVLVSFYYLSDRDLLFAHVQTSAGLLLCFMTISAGLPWHRGLWPQSLIRSCVSKFQTLADSLQFHSRTPKCCHSPFPDHLALWVQDTSGDLWEQEKIPRLLDSNKERQTLPWQIKVGHSVNDFIPTYDLSW